MMLRRQRRQRRGSILIESAIVYPVLFLIVLGIIVLSLAVFRYQQVAHITREATRWAAVHGAKYAEDNKPKTAATPQDVFDNAIKPHAVGMGLTSANMTYQVTWNESNAQTTSHVVTQPDGTKKTVTKANTVTVKVTYRWNTGVFGTIPVSSTSVMIMAY